MDWAAMLGIIIGLLWGILWLSREGAEKNFTVEDALEEVTLVDDFEDYEFDEEG